MVKTRTRLNTLGRETKEKKKGIGPSDDACMEVDAQTVNQEAQKAKGQKSIVKDIPEFHNNYLSWVDYTNVRELDNPRPSRINRDDDVAGEGSHDEIRVEEDVVGGVDTMGKTIEPSVVIEKSISDIGEDVPEEDSIDVSQADEIVTVGVKSPNGDALGKNVKPSIEDIMHGLKDGSTTRGYVLESHVDDCGKDTVDEGMDADIPSVVDPDHVITKAADEGVTPSVNDTDAETAGNMERPTGEQGVDDTMDTDIQEVIHEDTGQKKSKKRKHQKNTDVGKSSKPKKKLSKEERATKKARKVERRARRVAQEDVDVDDDVHEEVEDRIQKHEVPPIMHTTIDDDWLPEHELQGDNAEETQESDELQGDDWP
ncbi:hypothetical protein LIER_37151 [Lithospermum erythrorhizon]|uniref:Uncharacterized protein n=1 Tax=Lithospermum erythrorhizon TaxID=34254 RepID=A0AAV3PIY1_LITER